MCTDQRKACRKLTQIHLHAMFAAMYAWMLFGGSVLIQLMHIMHTARVSSARLAKPDQRRRPLMRDAACVTHTHAANATPADPHARSLFKLVSSSASFRPDFRLYSGRRVTGSVRVTFREIAARERSD